MSLPLYKKMIMEGPTRGDVHESVGIDREAKEDTWEDSSLLKKVEGNHYRVKRLAGAQEEETNLKRDAFWDLRGRTVCIDCHAAFDFIRKHDLRPESFMRSCPLPFDLYWLEWTEREKESPNFRGLQGAIVANAGCHRVGDVEAYQVQVCFVSGHPNIPGVQFGEAFAAFAIEKTTGCVCGWDSDADGKPTRYILDPKESLTSVELCGIVNRLASSDEEKQERQAAYLWRIFVLNWFMQVRNVVYETIPVGVREAKNLRKKAGDDSKLDFRTLQISREIIRSAKPKEPGQHRDMPLHLVMGHFKCYDEKPLFGSITGTFFWHAHTRGDKANGAIVKDYVAGKV